MKRIAFIGRVIRGGKNGFAHIASALEASGLYGDVVKLILHEGDPSKIAVRVANKGYIPVILYSLSTPLFLEYIGELARIARRHHVVVGGPHAAGAYWQVLSLGVDAAVIGDGEPAIMGLAEYYLGYRDISDVPNIAYLSGEKFKTGRVELARLDDYKPYSIEHRLYPPIEIMRGCMYRCTFCQVPWMFKSTVRYRSVDSVREAVKVYVKAGKRDIRFIAPIGFAYMSIDLKEPNVEAIEELLKGVVNEGGKPYLGTFPSETRPELVTKEVLSVIKRYAANRRIALGLQSGSEAVLKYVRRGHGVDEVVDAVNLIHSMGFHAVVDIIMGLPGEGDEDVEATVNVMMKLVELGAKIRLHTFLPLPGTPLSRAKPKPLHPTYKLAIRKLLGRGVLEGYWREQEALATKIYCLMAYYPTPTLKPERLESVKDMCSNEWKLYDKLYLENTSR